MLDLAKGLLDDGGEGGIVRWEAFGEMTMGGEGLDDDDDRPYMGAVLLPHEVFESRQAEIPLSEIKRIGGFEVTDKGDRTEWMYIDTWYVIGPFAHPGRDNLDKKFPPESVIDLDARYLGRDGQVIAWQYLQSPHPKIIPPYGGDRYTIYYFYTLLHAEKDMTLWAALGSDDYGKLWLNGKPVFTFGVTPHHWIWDRGWTRLELNKGANHLLYKLENAGGTMAMSIMLATIPNPHAAPVD
jgi:hypothetical protein